MASILEDSARKEALEKACWVAHTLFNRGKATGNSANLSFRYEDIIYITSTGSCFGRLTPEDFSSMTIDGHLICGRKPSKEFPLHQAMYQKDPACGGVIHTHSYHCTLWSCLPHPELPANDVVPKYTPYLTMKVGTIGLIPYAAPGSEELFALFRARIKESDGFLLANHGPIIGGEDILKAFYGIEELEESVHLALDLQQKNGRLIF